MSNEGYYIWLDAKADDEEIPAWKRLDIVTRKWAAKVILFPKIPNLILNHILKLNCSHVYRYHRKHRNHQKNIVKRHQ